MKIALIVIGIVVGLCSADIAAIDYFANGCEVDYDYTVTVRQPNGKLISTNGTKCHQFLIYTKQGAIMEKKYPG